jgi:transcriptional regulator with XRE-family HTH domain
MKLNNLFSSPFDKTLRSYNLTGKALSVESGVSQNHISDFRNGENITVEALSKLMRAMDDLKPGSVRDFLRQVSEQASPEPKATKFKASLENLIESATDEEIEGIMVAIARKWRLRNSNQEKELCA